MAIVLFHASSPEGELSLTEEQLHEWLGVIGRKLILKRDGFTQVKQAPFEATVQIDSTPDDADILDAVSAAFRLVGVVDGRVDVSVSEHLGSDLDFEAPAYFEQEVDLAHLEEKRTWAHVSVDLYAGVDNAHDGVRGADFPPGAVDALEREVRARAAFPLEFVGQGGGGLTANYYFRFNSVRMPPADVPTSEQVEQLALEVARAASMSVLKLEWQAYNEASGQNLYEGKRTYF